MQASLYDHKDTVGKATRMATWNHPGDSVYGLAARSHRVVDTMEDLLGGRSTTTIRSLPPRTLRWVARGNGCLQVVTGSHHCGRIEHGVLPGEQVGADPRRVEEILKRVVVLRHGLRIRGCTD